MATKVANGLDLQSQKIINLANPTAAQDAASKNYVDSVATGLDWHLHVRAASLANVTISAPGTTVDGVTAAANDRFLLTAQTTTSQNGPWVFVASGSPMTRPTDYAAGAVLTKSAATFFVTEGTSADSAWSLTTDGTITVDTTATAWAKVGGGTLYTAGNGLTSSAVSSTTTFSVLADPTPGSIQVQAAGIRVSTSAAGNGLTGGGAVALAVNAGNGILADGTSTRVDPAVVARKYTSTLGAITGGTPLTVTHNLNNKYVTAQLYLYNAGNNADQVIADITLIDANSLTVTVATTQGSSFYYI